MVSQARLHDGRLRDADLQGALQRSLQVAPAVFERQTLRSLLGDDPVVLRRLLQEFDTSTPQRLGALTAALRGADWPTAHAEAHSLKSAAQTVGALALAACCAKPSGLQPAPGLGPDEAAALAERITEGWPALQQALQSEVRAVSKDPAALG